VKIAYFDSRHQENDVDKGLFRGGFPRKRGSKSKAQNTLEDKILIKIFFPLEILITAPIYVVISTLSV